MTNCGDVQLSICLLAGRCGWHSIVSCPACFGIDTLLTTVCHDTYN